MSTYSKTGLDQNAALDLAIALCHYARGTECEKIQIRAVKLDGQNSGNEGWEYQKFVIEI